MNVRFALSSALVVVLATTTTAAAAPDMPPAGPPASSAAPAADPWPDLVAGNERFVAGHPQPHDLVKERNALAKGQAPRVAVLGCSDSRVAPEIVFDQPLGSLFVVRTAGNSPDPIAIGSLEYAVAVLGATEIVVLGHSSCGAVKAACASEKLPTVNLEAVVAAIHDSCAMKHGEAEPAAHDHVHRVAADLLAHSPILQERAKAGTLRVVTAFYSLDSGRVELVP